jgi:hypothetical protein
MKSFAYLDIRSSPTGFINDCASIDDDDAHAREMHIRLINWRLLQVVDSRWARLMILVTKSEAFN